MTAVTQVVVGCCTTTRFAAVHGFMGMYIEFVANGMCTQRGRPKTDVSGGLVSLQGPGMALYNCLMAALFLVYGVVYHLQQYSIVGLCCGVSCVC